MMAQDDAPKSTPLPGKDAKGRFAPGHKFAKGRAKGTLNKFGPNLREKLMAGIAASGIKRAKKAGVNHKIDGVEYFIEHLCDNSNAAAATLLAKLIPPESSEPPRTGSPMNINILPVESGQHFSPGNVVLLPNDECDKAWQAFRAGNDVWQAYLVTIEDQLTVAAFRKLKDLVAPEPDHPPTRDNVFLLAPAHHEEVELDGIVPRSPREAQLLTELKALPYEELVARARAAGLIDNPDDDA